MILVTFDINRLQGEIELLPDGQYVGDNVGFLANVLIWCEESLEVGFPKSTDVINPDFDLPNQGSWCMEDSTEQAEPIEKGSNSIQLSTIGVEA